MGDGFVRGAVLNYYLFGLLTSRISYKIYARTYTWDISRIIH